MVGAIRFLLIAAALGLAGVMLYKVVTGDTLEGRNSSNRLAPARTVNKVVKQGRRAGQGASRAFKGVNPGRRQ